MEPRLKSSTESLRTFKSDKYVQWTVVTDWHYVKRSLRSRSHCHWMLNHKIYPYCVSDRSQILCLEARVPIQLDAYSCWNRFLPSVSGSCFAPCRRADESRDRTRYATSTRADAVINHISVSWELYLLLFWRYFRLVIYTTRHSDVET